MEMAGSEADTPRERTQSPIWAITAYFNPVGYRRRLWNYRFFHEQLPLPLLAVEFGWQGRFDLSTEDADVMIQLEGPDVLWQRERLLNIAVAALPEHVSKIVWLDCDVLFDNDDWITDLDVALDQFPLVQAYSGVIRLPKQDRPRWQPEFAKLESRPSLCSLISPQHDLQGVCRDLPRKPDRVFPGPTGFGWAFRKELVQRHGFYDVGVLGGGDILFISALAGCYDIATRYHAMSTAAKRHYLRWAERFHRDVQQQVSCLPRRLYHLWHGNVDNRGYQTRYHHFDRFDFDPEADLALFETLKSEIN
ncbi:MAG: hypothetical protein JJ992_01275, partial [Planctomycetes bacterium]|nr:hypothetical protein [Planctomycetota bacterium]